MKVAFLLLTLSGVTFAAASDPAAAVLGYLEKVRSRTVDISSDTALSPHTSPDKREQINRRLSRLAEDLGKGRLEAAEMKVDGDLAAVVIRNSGGFDPSKARVVSIGLIKTREHWLPAPVPASFENTGTALHPTGREKAGALEAWMMRAQVEELTVLREQSRERMQKDIHAAMDAKILREESSQKVVDGFLQACGKQNLPAILGFLGGLQSNPPADWSERLRSADAAVNAGKKVGWPWRLLMAPEIIRVRVEDGGETNDGLFSFGCLDPAGSGRHQATTKVEILHIELSRDQEGLWKVDLPEVFLVEPGMELDESGDSFVKFLLDDFPVQVRKQIPARPNATISEAATALDEALRARDLTALISLMDLEGDPGTANRGSALGAKFWWQIHNPEAPRMGQLLGHYEHGNAGVVTFQFFSTREPGIFDLKSFYFEKTASGWLLMPGLKLTNSPTKDQTAVRDWVVNRDKAWRGGWQAKLAENSTRVFPITEGNAPTEDEAKALVESWLTATHTADIRAALNKIVIVNHQGETERSLRNLGFEFITAIRNEGRFSVIHCEQGSTWTTVGVKSQDGTTATFPLYLVLNTPDGPKILISADLFGESTSGRNKLNETVLNRIRDLTTPAVSEELRNLFTKFRSKING